MIFGQQATSTLKIALSLLDKQYQLCEVDFICRDIAF